MCSERSDAGSPEGGAFHVSSLGDRAWGTVPGGRAPRPTVVIRQRLCVCGLGGRVPHLLRGSREAPLPADPLRLPSGLGLDAWVAGGPACATTDIRRTLRTVCDLATGAAVEPRWPTAHRKRQYPCRVEAIPANAGTDARPRAPLGQETLTRRDRILTAGRVAVTNR